MLRVQRGCSGVFFEARRRGHGLLARCSSGLGGRQWGLVWFGNQDLQVSPWACWCVARVCRTSRISQLFPLHPIAIQFPLVPRKVDLPSCCQHPAGPNTLVNRSYWIHSAHILPGSLWMGHQRISSTPWSSDLFQIHRSLGTWMSDEACRLSLKQRLESQTVWRAPSGFLGYPGIPILLGNLKLKLG